MPIYIIDTLQQQGGASFPIVEDVDIKGGFRTVASEALRDAIPASFRVTGMFVWTQDTGKLWRLTSLPSVLPGTWVEFTGGGSGTSLGATYLALVSGVQSAGAAYKIIGALPTMDYAALGASSLTLTATLNIPAGSTAQVRLYDKTNAGTIWESAVIAGPQTEYELSQLVAPAAGTSLLEFWLATPTDIGGDASCLTAGILAAR